MRTHGGGPRARLTRAAPFETSLQPNTLGKAASLSSARVPFLGASLLPGVTNPRPCYDDPVRPLLGRSLPQPVKG